MAFFEGKTKDPFDYHPEKPSSGAALVPALSAETTPQPSFVSVSPTSSSSTPSPKSDMDGSTPDVQAIAELFATLKRTVSALHSTFDKLGTQVEKMAYLAPATQTKRQIEGIRFKLEQQITRHEKAMNDVQRLLEQAISDNLVDRLKADIYDVIHERVAQEVESRVRQEARRHNANLRSPSMDAERLRPLLRPLPSALQSPAYVLKQPFTANNSNIASPVTAFPAAPMPTPMVARIPAIVFPPGSKQVFELVPPTPSPLFPRDMRSLFALGPDAAKQLLNDYGLQNTSAAPSPSKTDGHRIRVATQTGLNTPVTSPVIEPHTTREEDINKFMAHIGVPYLMVPAPKPKSGPRLHLVIPRGSPIH
ncbi:hypothetical protein C0991_007250 [Blastosporella zonata]|nr:hypothetical protein C0991_007250 [Blastosporella zonata]